MADVAEIGWLCRNVEGFVKESQDGKRPSSERDVPRETGLVEQVCCLVQSRSNYWSSV